MAAHGAKAQVTVNLNLPQANITSQTDYSVEALNGTFSNGLGLLPFIYVAASAPANVPSTTTTGNSIPLTAVFIKLFSVGTTGVLSGTSEIGLTNSTQAIYTALLALGGGPITNTYRIKTSGNPWIAGTYTTTLNFTSILLTSVTPAAQTLTINVPAFITPNVTAPATTLLHVNSLPMFRSTSGVSSSSIFDYYTSVPTLLNLRASNSTFTFSTTYPYNQLPAAQNVNQVKANITDAQATAAISLSATDQPLTVTAGMPVIATNDKSITSVLNIPGATLSSNFVQAGTYTTPIVYTIAKTAAAYPAALTSATMNSSLQVLVDDMSELILQDASVSLVFNTAAIYKAGVTKQMPNHLKASATVPYDVTVKASSNFLTSGTGAQIPVGVITIEGMPSQTGITPVVLSSSPQKIISSANPGIDRFLSLQYRIPAAQTPNLLNKAAGNYTTTVTYTLVAP